jgi:serine protease Do
MREARRHFPLGIALLLLSGAPAGAQPAPCAEPGPAGTLREGTTTLADLAARVSPAVVQILVTALVPTEEDEWPVAGVVVRHRFLGSGVILDPDGYILTNAHMVKGARLVEVRLFIPPTNSGVPPVGSRKCCRAALVGSDPETDLALLKIDGKGLPALALGDGRRVRPGQQVMAVGSPEGLYNSITFGAVSAVGREFDGNEFLQTDAHINPGNSGGPLVDLEGYVLGLNTFLISQGGGSEGLGFAIPARTLRFVYERLRRYGHVTRVEIQAEAQSVTPGLATGLGLAQGWGVVVSDVVPEGPAEKGGLRPKDVVLSVDGEPVFSLPGYTTAIATHPLEEPLRMELLRGTGKLSLTIAPQPKPHEAQELPSRAAPANRVGRLGIFAETWSAALSDLIPEPRVPAGIVVLALSPDPTAVTASLRVGDLIHDLNDVPLVSVDHLRAELDRFKEGDQGVLTVERQGKRHYLEFEIP